MSMRARSGRVASAATPGASSVVAPALLIAIATRCALFFISWLSLRAFPRFSSYPEQLPDNFLPSHPFLDGWARWDASHYVAVARLGYGDPASPSPHGGLGFFPLYPLVMRALVAVSGVERTNGAYAVAGIVVSNLCFLAAVALFALLAREVTDARTAMQSVLLLCVAPFGFFFNASYSESLFLLIAISAMWFGRRGQWWAAAAIAGLGSATRLVGLAIGPAVLYAAWKRKASPRDLLAICVLSPSGLIAFFVYCAVKFDDLLAYFDAQSEWGGWREHVWDYVDLFATRPREALSGDSRHLIILINVGLLLLCLALLPMVWRRLDPGIAALTTLLVVVQGAITWVSLGRYLMPAFGIYLAGGLLLNRPRLSGWPRDAIVVSSSLLLSLLTVLYAHGFWVV